jgi:hypothetical protein
MSNEERPRLSLRLRGLSGTPPEAPSPETPPAAPSEPVAPAPAAPPPSDPATDSPLLASLRKPRLASLLGTPPAEPGPAAPLEPVPESAPLTPSLEPPPLPAAALEPPPLSKTPPAFPPPGKTAGPVFKASRNPANFPPPPGYGSKRPVPSPATTAKPERKPAIALVTLLVLLIGGAGALYFFDPLGLFGKKAPPTVTAAQPEPAATEPVKTEPAAAEPTPAREEPSAATVAVAPPEEPREIEPPPPPPPLPEITNAIAALKVSGARMNSSGGVFMVGTKVYNAGAVLDPELGITFVSFKDGTFTFRDERGAIYQRRF